MSWPVSILFQGVLEPSRLAPLTPICPADSVLPFPIPTCEERNMSIIEYVEAREILDSRGNPTVEVDVVLERRRPRPRRRSLRRQHRRVRGRRAARRRQEALPRQGRAQGRRERQRRDRRRDLSASTPLDQVGIDRTMIDARRHREQGQARRQRHPRRLAGRRPSAAADCRRPAALPVPRRPQRPRAARAR